MNGLHSLSPSFGEVKPPRTPRERSSQPKEVVRKNVVADQLLEALPVRFKKTVRQLIEEYESERVELLKLLKQTPTSDLQIYSYKKKLEQLVQENSWLGKEVASWQERARTLQFQLDEAYKRIEEKEEEVNVFVGEVDCLNSALELFREQCQHEEAMLRHRFTKLERRLQAVTQQLTEKERRFKESQQRFGKQESETKIMENKLSLEQKKNLELRDRIGDLERQLRKKKIVEIRDVLSRSREKEPESQTTTPAFNELSNSSCFRKLSEAFSPKPRANSPVRASIGDSIKRAKDMLTNKFDTKKEDISEPDSLEFGKQKVIEKKKVRKLIADLISSAAGERRPHFERLSMEIGLKEADTERFLELL